MYTKGQGWLDLFYIKYEEQPWIKKGYCGSSYPKSKGLTLR